MKVKYRIDGILCRNPKTAIKLAGRRRGLSMLEHGYERVGAGAENFKQLVRRHYKQVRARLKEAA